MNRSDNFERFARTAEVRGDLKRKSVIGALVTGAGGSLDFVLRLGSTLILARLLVPEHFGLVAMVTVLTRIAERFSTLGLSTATVQAPEITEGQCTNLFWMNASAGLVFSAALVLFAPAIADFYDDPRLAPISLALAANFVSMGLTVQHEALLRRRMKLSQIAGNRLLATLLSVSLSIALAFTGFGYWALVWKEVAQAALIALGSWVLCPWLPGLPSRRVNMGRLLGFGRDMTLTQLLLAVSAQLDSLLIGRFSGAFELGLYRQANNLMRAPMERLRGPIFTVSQPGLSTLQREPERYRRYYRRIVFAVSLATMPLGVFTAIYAHEIVVVALGEKWLGAVVFLRILSVVAAVQPAIGTTGIVMVTCGKSARFLWVSIVNSLVLVGLMFAGIGWGAVGIAAARVATPLLLLPWVLRYSFAGSPVGAADFVSSVAKPVTASLAMAGLLLTFRHFVPISSPALSVIAGIVGALLGYFVAFRFIPGGWGQLTGLVGELLSVLKRRSSNPATGGV